MEGIRGQVVRSKAGHDKEGFLAVLEISPPYVLLCDGKRRPLERPKRKKLIHVAPTATVLPEAALKTDRSIRAALRAFVRQSTEKDG